MHRRRIAIVAGAALLLVVGLVLALPLIVDLNRYRGQIEAALRQQLHREVTLGDMRLSVVPPGLTVENALISEDPAFQTGRPFARLQRISVRPKLMPLLRGAFELHALAIDAPEFELVRGSRGQWNVATLGGDNEPASPSAESSIVLDRLSITGGQIAITDLRSPPGSAAPRQLPDTRRAVYKNIDVQLAGFAPRRAFDLVLGVTFPGSSTGRLDVQGKAGPLDRDDAAMTPFEGTASLEQVSIGGVLRFADVAALDDTDAAISGSASLRNELGVLSSRGRMQFDAARVHGVAIGYPIAARFDLTHDLGAQRLTIKEGTLSLDKTPISLTGSVNLQPEIPALDVRATAADASLAEAARLASAFGVAFGANTQVQGRATLDVRAQGPATAPALEGTLRVRDVSISGAGIAQPVQAAAIEVTLTPAAIRSNDFVVTTAGTSVGARAALTGYTTPKPAIDARVRATGDLGEVLSVARAWGAGVEGVSGSGRMTLDAGVSGPLDALTFTGSGSLTDATLRTPSFTQPVRIRTAILSFNRDAAVLEKLAAGIGKTSFDGRLSVRSFTSPRVDFQLAADRIDVRELQALLAPARTPAPQLQKTTKPSGPSDTLFTRTTGSGRLRVGAIVYDKVILDDVDAMVTLDRGLVRLNPLTAGLFGGRHRGSIDVDARRTPAALTIASTLEKVDANRLTSAVTGLKDILYGALGATVRMTLSGESAASAARSLNGTLALDLAEGRIATLSLRQEIANAARFIIGAPPTERGTRVAGLTGTFTVKDGLARTDDLTASIEGGRLGASGTIDLADERVNLRLTTVLSAEASQKAGGSRIVGLMTTALANEQGEIVVPLLVTGTMSAPRVAPDLERVSEMKLKKLVPRMRNPRGLTSGILGALGGSTEPGAEKTDAKKADVEKKDGEKKDGGKKDTVTQVEDALRDLLRRRTPAEKPPDPPPQPPQ